MPSDPIELVIIDTFSKQLTGRTVQQQAAAAVAPPASNIARLKVTHFHKSSERITSLASVSTRYREASGSSQDESQRPLSARRCGTDLIYCKLAHAAPGVTDARPCEAAAEACARRSDVLHYLCVCFAICENSAVAIYHEYYCEYEDLWAYKFA